MRLALRKATSEASPTDCSGHKIHFDQIPSGFAPNINQTEKISTRKSKRTSKLMFMLIDGVDDRPDQESSFGEALQRPQC